MVATANNIFVAVVVVSFAALLALATGSVEPERLLRADLPAVIPAIPTMFVSLVYVREATDH